MMTLTDPNGNRQLYNRSAGRLFCSDPNYLHLLLTPNKTVLWTWTRLLQQTTLHTDTHLTHWSAFTYSPN